MVKCPVCGKRVGKEALVRHLRNEHGIENPAEAYPELLKRVRSGGAEIAIDHVIVKGVEIRIGDCLRAVIGRNVYIMKVDSFTDNPTVVHGLDIYGQEIAVDLRKAIVLSKLTPEKFEFLSSNAKRRKKAEGGEEK